MNPIIQPTIAEHLFVVGLVAMGLFAVLRGQRQMKQTHFDRSERIQTYWLNGAILFLAAAVPVVLWWLAGRPLADLGLTAGSFDARAAILTLVFVVWWAGDATWRMTGPRRAQQLARLQRDTGQPVRANDRLRDGPLLLPRSRCWSDRGGHLSWLPDPVRCRMDRQFPRRSPDRVRRVTLAVLFPALWFGFVHLYQGWRIVGWIVVMSILFGAIFLVTSQAPARC